MTSYVPITAGICVMVLFVWGASAMSPPSWMQPGTTFTYEAALTPYYELEHPDQADPVWVQPDRSGVYGYWYDTIRSVDELGYSGDYTIVEYYSGNTLVAQPWSYQTGDAGMSLFWVDPEGFYCSSTNLVAEGPLELGGRTWNAQIYYYSSIGNTFDTKITVDKDSGLVLSKNEGLTGNNGQMQRAIYILRSIG